MAFTLQRRKLRSAFSVGLLLLIVVSAAPAGVWERVGGLRSATSVSNLSEVDPEGSAEQRFEIWQVAVRVVREHAVTETGV